jgi:hypothetical protein
MEHVVQPLDELSVVEMTAFEARSTYTLAELVVEQKKVFTKSHSDLLSHLSTVRAGANLILEHAESFANSLSAPQPSASKSKSSRGTGHFPSSRAQRMCTFVPSCLVTERVEW